MLKPETIKLLEENLHSILSDINHSKIFFDPRIMEIKKKNKQMEPNKTWKPLHSKGNNKKD